MAEIVCIIGNKGGTGKTTLSHMLSHGLGLLGHRSVCVLTDPGREPLQPSGRRYLIADARSREAMGKVMDKIMELKGWLGVIDGGANRGEMDRKLYGIAHAVVLPFRDSHEDMRTVLRDLEAFPRAWALPSQWPTNAWQRDAANRAVEQLLARHRARIMEPVSAVSASKLLLCREMPESIPTPLSNACRRLARQVLDILRLPYDEACAQPEPEGTRPLTPPQDPAAVPAPYSSDVRH